MLERGGDLRAMHLRSGRRGVLKSIIQNNVTPGSTVLTDEYAAYTTLPETYQHHSVNHSAGEYVRDGFVHTNSLEGAWSLLKRQIYGIHHWVSPKHLQRYVDEMSWRYNRRQMSMGERVNALIAGSDGRLKYRVLTA